MDSSGRSPPAPLKPVAYANLGDVEHAFQRWRVASLAHEEVIRRLRSAIEAEDFWIVDEIDPQVLLSQGGYAMSPARQLLFFHPRYAARILEADPAALLEAPLKFTVLKLPHNAVTVRWLDPIASFARYRNAALEEVGQELSRSCDSIVASSLPG
jgi:uncharacterized protein (DUF302 family)